MNNNDLLIRLRYALDIKNTDLIEIFKLGGVQLTKEEVLKMLTKASDKQPNEVVDFDDSEENEAQLKCNDLTITSFLNGFIIFKRGRQEAKPDQTEGHVANLKSSESVNNILLKKVKIALSLNSEEMLEILELGGGRLTKGELSAVFRKEGHKNYKECGDRYARNFLKGLAIKYRK